MYTISVGTAGPKKNAIRKKTALPGNFKPVIFVGFSAVPFVIVQWTRHGKKR
jgi:hypothetical protein